jgi:hypothetical protein
VHQISLPWHWGNYTTNDQGVTGDSANDLVPLTGDPNVSIEDKSFSCNVRPGRRSRSGAGAAGESSATERGTAHAASPSRDHAAEQPRHSGAQKP